MTGLSPRWQPPQRTPAETNKAASPEKRRPFAHFWGFLVKCPASITCLVVVPRLQWTMQRLQKPTGLGLRGCFKELALVLDMLADTASMLPSVGPTASRDHWNAQASHPSPAGGS